MSKLSGYAVEVERMGETNKRDCQPVAERTDLENMEEAPVTPSDPFRSGGYSRNKVTIPVEGFCHRRLWVQRYFFGRWRDVPVPIPLLQFIRMGKEEGLLDGLRYALIPTDARSSVADGRDRRDTARSSWKHHWNHRRFCGAWISGSTPVWFRSRSVQV